MAFKKRKQVPRWNTEGSDDNTHVGQRSRAKAALLKAKEIEKARVLSGEYEWISIDKGMKLVKKGSNE